MVRPVRRLSRRWTWRPFAVKLILGLVIWERDMRRFLSRLSFLLILPLAACFDVEMSVNFIDDENAEGTMVMTASPEFYAMATSSGEPFCEGVDTAQADGSHTCTETFTGTIEEIMNDPDMADGMTIERREGGMIYIAFDLGDLTEEVAPPEEEGAEAEQMKQMMMAAFVGHKIALNVSGSRIVETNGILSEDGKTARFEIPLETLLEPEKNLPESFNALLIPGS